MIKSYSDIQVSSRANERSDILGYHLGKQTGCLWDEISDYARRGDGRTLTGVDVHLDDTVVNSSFDLFFGRARASVENEVPGMRQYSETSWIATDETDLQRLLLATQLRARVSLMLVQKLGVQLDVPRLVHTVYVSKCSCDAEVGADLDQRIVHIIHILWLGVQCGVVNASVVHTVLFSTRDTDLHLEPDSEGSQFLKVFDAHLDILLLGFLGEVEHVRGK